MHDAGVHSCVYVCVSPRKWTKRKERRVKKPESARERQCKFHELELSKGKANRRVAAWQLFGSFNKLGTLHCRFSILIYIKFKFLKQ